MKPLTEKAVTESASIPPPAPNEWLRPALIGSWREIILMILLVIGPSAVSSTYAALHGSGHKFIGLLFNDHRMLRSLAAEGLLLAVFLYLLHRRGWRPFDFRMHIGPRTSGQGLLLLILTCLTHFICGVLLLLLVYSLQRVHPTFLSFTLANAPYIPLHSLHVSGSLVAVCLIVNGFFEEMTCTGYIFTQLAARRGPLFALLVTVMLRMTCHTYQDPISLVRIGAVFLVFGLWYWHTRKLWPLVLAHILLDLLSAAFVITKYG